MQGGEAEKRRQGRSRNREGEAREVRAGEMEGRDEGQACISKGRAILTQMHTPPPPLLVPTHVKKRVVLSFLHLPPQLHTRAGVRPPAA